MREGPLRLTEGYILAGRYRILRMLGKGGMGIVYAAHDRELDEKVAVKVLRPDVGHSTDMARRFRSEIKLARRVRHRNVCGIHEFGQDGHLQFIAMELIEGVDLKRLLRQRGPFDAEHAFDMAIQVTEGLAAIHEVGILHRDLKTPNLMRDTHGVVRLMDFGIAKQVDAVATAATATGEVLGTPEYMSPEQIRGEKLDVRSDLYALGIVVFELFTGELPFRGDTPVNTFWMQLNDPPPLDGPRAARLPRAVVPVLARALAKSAADRHASSHDLAEALREARAHALPDAPRTVPPWRILTATAPQTQAQTLAAPSPAAVVDMTARLGETRVSGTKPGALPTPAVAGRAPMKPGLTMSGRGLWLAAAVGVAVVAAVGLAIAPGRVASPPSLAPSPTLAASTSLPSDPATTPSASPETRVAPDSERPPTSPLAASPAASPPKRDSVEPRRASADVAARTAPRGPASPDTGQPQSAREAAEPALPAPHAAGPGESLRPTGQLHLRVVPQAQVELDGTLLGSPPGGPLTLAPGEHRIRLLHPDYKPLVRKPTIRAGETLRLEVDLTQEAFPK